MPSSQMTPTAAVHFSHEMVKGKGHLVVTTDRLARTGADLHSQAFRADALAALAGSSLRVNFCVTEHTLSRSKSFWSREPAVPLVLSATLLEYTSVQVLMRERKIAGNAPASGHASRRLNRARQSWVLLAAKAASGPKKYRPTTARPALTHRMTCPT